MMMRLLLSTADLTDDRRWAAVKSVDVSPNVVDQMRTTRGPKLASSAWAMVRGMVVDYAIEMVLRGMYLTIALYRLASISASF